MNMLVSIGNTSQPLYILVLKILIINNCIHQNNIVLYPQNGNRDYHILWSLAFNQCILGIVYTTCIRVNWISANEIIPTATVT